MSPNQPYRRPPEELTLAVDAMKEHEDQVAMRMAKLVDMEITKGLQMRLGLNWLPRDLVGRLDRTLFDDGSETMSLDGQPFIHIGPWVQPLYDPLRVGATRAITHLKGPDEGLPN